MKESKLWNNIKDISYISGLAGVAITTATLTTPLVVAGAGVGVGVGVSAIAGYGAASLIDDYWNDVIWSIKTFSFNKGRRMEKTIDILTDTAIEINDINMSCIELSKLLENDLVYVNALAKARKTGINARKKIKHEKITKFRIWSMFPFKKKMEASEQTVNVTPNRTTA